MKTSKILLQPGKSNNEETPRKGRAGKFLKFALVIFILSWVALLSSCTVFVRTPRHDNSGRVIIEQRGHDERRGHNERREH